jgi:salicylate 5-hydroxylase small subunit
VLAGKAIGTYLGKVAVDRDAQQTDAEQSVRAMLLDRVYSIKEALFHDPYYQRHIISSPIMHHATSDEWQCETNYAVFRTKLSDTTTVFNVGRSFDTIVRNEHGLQFARRECIYDSEMIPNSIIYPV